jgi:hypothetical protein
MSVVDPVAHEGRDPVPVVPPLGDLAGKRVVVLDITKVRSEAFAAEVRRRLAQAVGAEVDSGVVMPAQRMSDEELERVAGSCDGAVLTLADCGTCTTWTAWDAIELHRRGCRAVLVTTEALRPMLGALVGRLGMADLPLVAVPQPNRDQTVEEIAATAAAAVPAIVRALAG